MKQTHTPYRSGISWLGSTVFTCIKLPKLFIKAVGESYLSLLTYKLCPRFPTTSVPDHPDTEKVWQSNSANFYCLRCCINVTSVIPISIIYFKIFLFHIQYCPYNHLGLQAMFSIIALIWNTKQSEPMIHGRSIIWKKSKPRLWKLDQGTSVMTSLTAGQVYTKNKDVYTVHKKVMCTQNHGGRVPR